MKTQTNSTIRELIDSMKRIDAQVRRMPKPTIPETIQRGLDVSKAASAQQELVEMTPLFRNALTIFDGFTDDSRLRVNDPETKAEKWFKDACLILLTKYCGTAKEYNERLPLLSVEHYNVQCWQNLKDNWRDIQPGQADERKAAAADYTRATDSKKIFSLLEGDRVFQKAVLLVMSQIPEVRASEEFLEVNLPFMSKHTNVNDPYWQNDRNLAPNGQTYAQLTMDIAKKIGAGSNLSQYNLSTMYGRNQRGKGRLIIAVSRIINLWLNRLEAKEIEAYRRKSPLFVGYGDDQQLKSALSEMVNDAMNYGLLQRNMDQSRYDRHVSYGLILLLGAISISKANGARSKDIAFWRAVYMSKTWLVNGLTGKIEEIYGRIFSGFIDTNRGGGIINALITTYCCMKQDPSYSSYVYDSRYSMLVMGDDNNFLYKNLDHKRMIEDMKDLGFDVNPEKDEFGPMFLQYRLFEDPQTHERVMAYAWTRVLRSMLMKETGRGLGPAGWTFAFWQQLSKLTEYPLALKIVVNLILPFDKEGLMLDKPVSDIVKMMQEEDKAKLEEAKTKAQVNRVTSTIDKLNDGDPTKSRFQKSIENGGSGYLTDLQAKIKAARDPNFLASVGIRVPAKKL